MNKGTKLLIILLGLPLIFLSACNGPPDPDPGVGGGVVGNGNGDDPDDPGGGGDTGGGTGGKWAIIFSGSEVMFPDAYSTACRDNVFNKGSRLDFTAVELTGEAELRFDIYQLIDKESGDLEILHREDFGLEQEMRMGLPDFIGSEAGEYYLTVGSPRELADTLGNRAELPPSAYCFMIE